MRSYNHFISSRPPCLSESPAGAAGAGCCPGVGARTMANTSLNGKFNSGAMRRGELFDDNNNNFPAHKTYPRSILCDSIHDRERAGRVVWGRPFPRTESDTWLLKVIDVLASVDSSDRRKRSAASGGCDCSGRACGLLEKEPLFLSRHCVPFPPAGWPGGGGARSGQWVRGA